MNIFLPNNIKTTKIIVAGSIQNNGNISCVMFKIEWTLKDHIGNVWNLNLYIKVA